MGDSSLSVISSGASSATPSYPAAPPEVAGFNVNFCKNVASQNAVSIFKSMCEELKERNSERVFKQIYINEPVSIRLSPPITILKYLPDGSNSLHRESDSEIDTYFVGQSPDKRHCFFHTSSAPCNNIVDKIQYEKLRDPFKDGCRFRDQLIENRKKCFKFIERNLSNNLESELEDVEARYVVSQTSRNLDNAPHIREVKLQVSDQFTDQVLGETKFYNLLVQQNSDAPRACPRTQPDALASLLKSIFQK